MVQTVTDIILDRGDKALLLKAIKHWEAMIEEVRDTEAVPSSTAPRADYCALCKKYYPSGAVSCDRKCPLARLVGRCTVHNTENPWAAASTAYIEERLIDFVIAATKMTMLLQSLLYSCREVPAKKVKVKAK